MSSVVFEDHIGLANKIAYSYRVWANKRNMQMDDILQESYIGLMDAVKQYHPEKGKFSTFATRTINNDIRNFMRLRRAAPLTPSQYIPIEEIEIAKERPNDNGFLVQEILDLVPEEDKNILIFKLCGYSDADIGKKRGCSQQAINARYRKIILNVQASLGV